MTKVFDAVVFESKITRTCNIYVSWTGLDKSVTIVGAKNVKDGMKQVMKFINKNINQFYTLDSVNIIKG